MPMLRCGLGLRMACARRLLVFLRVRWRGWVGRFSRVWRFCRVGSFGSVFGRGLLAFLGMRRRGRVRRYSGMWLFGRTGSLQSMHRDRALDSGLWL